VTGAQGQNLPLGGRFGRAGVQDGAKPLTFGMRAPAAQPRRSRQIAAGGASGESAAGALTTKRRQISSSRSRFLSRAVTQAGSNSLPDSSPRYCSASSLLQARLYGRLEISASNTSATATMRASSGISSPARPSG